MCTRLMRRLLRPLLLLLVLPTAGLAAPAPGAAEPVPAIAAEEGPDLGAGAPAVGAAVAPGTAADACYQAARDNARDPAPCDLVLANYGFAATPAALAAAHSNRGLILAASGALDAALADHEAAVSLLPGHPRVLANYGTTLLLLGRYAEALAAYTDALGGYGGPRAAIGDQAAILFNRALAHRGLGNLAAARADFRSATRPVGGPPGSSF